MTDKQKNKLKQLAKQIKKNPDDSFSKFALALEFRKDGQYAKARMLFENILSSDPEYLGVYYHLGKLYEMMDQLKESRELYKKGLALAEKKNEKRTKSELQEALNQVEMEIQDLDNTGE